MTMRRTAFFALIALFSVASSIAAFGACTTQLAFSAISPNLSVTEREWGVTFTNCPAVTATTFTPNTAGTLNLGGIQYTANILRFVPPTAISPNPQVTFKLALPQGQNDPVNTFYATSSALFSYPVGGTLTTWPLVLTEALNVKTHSFHIGRADATGQSSDASLPAIPPAYRLQIASSYSYRPPFVPTSAANTFASKLQRDFAFKIDSTDKDKGYIDDNSVTAGLFLPRLNLASAIAQGKIGGEVSYDRPLHNNDHNADATATAAGLIPAVQALNLFSTQRKLASPLSLAISAGYRSKRMTGENYRGRVFSGTAFYHLYLMDNYRIDLTATTTFNDLSKLPAGTPKTQHAFTAAIYYEPSPNAPFNAMASFQNGSFGAVLTKLKQYFIGVSISKIDQLFGSPAP
jgi:hypothetical protein